MGRGIKMKNKVFWNLIRGDYWEGSQVVFILFQDVRNLGERQYVILKNGSVYFGEESTQEIVQLEPPID